MNLRDILHAKGHQVFSTDLESSLGEVVKKLIENNCGSLVVMDGDKMVGIITERDILKASSQLKSVMEAAAVRDHMTSEVVTGGLDDDVAATMGLLTRKRIRHLPVTDGEKLLGVISIGDVVKAQFDQLAVENHYLRSYIQG